MTEDIDTMILAKAERVPQNQTTSLEEGEI